MTPEQYPATDIGNAPVPQPGTPATAPSMTQLIAKVDALEAEVVAREHRLSRAVWDLITRKGKRWHALRAVVWALFAPQAVLTLSVGFTAVAGIYLAWRANELLEQQNRRIDTQIYLADSARPSTYAVEYSSVMAELDRFPAMKDPSDDYKKQLDRRITNLSIVLKPLRPLAAPSSDSLLGLLRPGPPLTNDGVPQVQPFYECPERTQLLLAMQRVSWPGLDSPFETRPYDLSYANFAKMNLSSASFERLNLQHADFSGAMVGSIGIRDVNRASFKKCRLRGARFASAFVLGAKFDGADLRDADFGGALLGEVSFDEATLKGAQFEGAVLTTHGKAPEVVVANWPGFDLGQWKFRQEKVKTDWPEEWMDVNPDELDWVIHRR